MADLRPTPARSTGLVDVLDRVLDKGLVVAGDIKVSLAEVELLTIRIRLIVCSIDKAQEIGLDWWKHDHHLASGKSALTSENDRLRRQIEALEQKVALLSAGAGTARRQSKSRKARLARSDEKPRLARSDGKPRR